MDKLHNLVEAQIPKWKMRIMPTSQSWCRVNMKEYIKKSHSAIKRNEIALFAEIRMDLEIVTESEI